MKRVYELHRAVLPGLAMVSLAGAMAISAAPARAGNLGQDAAVGAAAGAGVGLILNGRADVGDIANGAASGAACNLANEEFRNGDTRDMTQDLAIGAAAGAGLGLIINDDNSLLENAAQGAAACAAGNVVEDISR